jgi:phosphoinositide-3-kinase regulatory subunit alpha/beta/delta
VLNKTTHEVTMKRQAMDAFVEAISMFKEQVRVHEEFKTKAQPHEVQMLKANHDMLTDRLAQLEESRAHLDKSLRSKVTFSRTLERDINNLKPDMKSLKNKKDLCAK